MLFVAIFYLQFNGGGKSYCLARRPGTLRRNDIMRTFGVRSLHFVNIFSLCV